MRFIVTIGALISLWLAVSEAHGIFGWRTLLLPFLFFIMLVLIVVLLNALAAGTTMTVDALLKSFGMAP